jgi:CRP/FNR family cyclic AMP-dependent transcriptional regulator
MTPNPTDRNRPAEALRGLPVFAGASPAELAKLATTSQLFRFRSGARLLEEEAGHCCLALTSGRVRRGVPRGANGELTLEIFEAGDLVDAGCWCAPSTPRIGHVVAIEGGTALRLPRAALESFLEANPVVAIRLLRSTSERLASAVEAMSRNACLPIVDRLYRFLVDVAPRRGRETGDGLLIQHGLAQHELAACIGASRELVNRHLSQWKDEGLVVPRRRALLVTNRRGLSQSVSPQVRCERFASGSDRLA